MIDVIIAIAFLTAVVALTSIPFLLHRSVQLQLNNYTSDCKIKLDEQTKIMRDLQEQIILVREHVSRISAQVYLLLEGRNK